MLNAKVKLGKASFKRKRDNCSRKKIKKLLKYFRSELGSSTTHGLSYVVNSDIHWFERMFWTVSFLFSGALIGVLLWAQFTRFMEQPIVMSVEKDYFNWNISFPAILLCPLDKIDENMLTQYKNDSQFLFGQDLEPYLESIATATLETLHVIQTPEREVLHVRFLLTKITLISPKDYARLAAEVFKPFQNESLSSKTDWPVSVEPVMTEMGMCHMINSNIAVFDNPTKWSAKDTTYAKNNIELSFHDQDFYIELINYTDSFKIFIQSPDEMILNSVPVLTYDTEGLLTFGVQMSSTTASDDLRSMSTKFRKCRFGDEPNSSRYPVYSYNRCLMECRIKMILKLCNCLPHFYKPLGNEKICNLAELDCLVDYLKDILALSISNQTISKLENLSYFSFDGLPRNSRDCGCLGDCQSSVYMKDSETFVPQSGLNRLKITVSTFPRVRMIRERIFSFFDIILRTGGVINLCIGSSFISIMELILTIIRIPIYCIIRMIKCIYKPAQCKHAWVKKNK